MDKYKHYLRGRKFLIKTDNAAVSLIMKPQADASKYSAEIQRWRASLMEYEYSIEHVASKHNISDPLSRLLPPNN